MAGPTPQLALASPRARAQGKLLHLADHLQRIRTRWVSRGGRNVHGIYVFQVLAGTKVTEPFARVGNSFFSDQVALLANAVTSSGWQVCGIDDGARQGTTQVSFKGSVAAFTADCFCLKG